MKTSESTLVITIDHPYPDDTGGRQLTLGRIMNLSNKGKVAVICFNFKNIVSRNVVDFFLEKGISFDEFIPLSTPLIKIRSLLESFFSSLPRQAILIKESRFNLYLQNKLKQSDTQITSVYIDSIFLTPSVIEVITHLLPNATIVICFHNIESKFLNSLSRIERTFIRKLIAKLDSLKTYLLELKIGKLSQNKNIRFNFLTTNDKEFYVNNLGFPSLKCSLNTNSIYIPFKIEHKPNTNNPFFLFPGSINFPPNLEAILLIARTYEDLKCSAQILVTGEYSETNAETLKRFPHIKLTGKLEKNHLLDLYSQCISVISPVVSGGGIKMKNLEALSLGIPIILTEFSNIGIPESQLKTVTQNSGADFANAMMKCYLKNINN